MTVGCFPRSGSAVIDRRYSIANKLPTPASKFSLKMETGIQLLDPPRFQRVPAESLTKPCIDEGFRVSSALPKPAPMNPKPILFRPWALGLMVTLLQIIAAVLIAPEGPLSFRYNTLIQHDSYWFANIVDRGFESTVPPVSHKMMEVSNVAFFPAYPAIAAILHYGARLSIYDALLVTAQAAAWAFWSYFFLFCQRWNVSPLLQFFGALAILAHPTAFFLVAGYSESLFMMGLFGFMFWSTSEGKGAKFLAILHGALMSATRIVGIPCSGYPVFQTVVQHGWRSLREIRSWWNRYAPAAGVMLGATLGAGIFFFYCLLRWGRWDMYLLTQQSGWAIIPDYLAVFKPSSYRWLIPALKNPTEASQMTMTLGGMLLIGVMLGELLPIVRRRFAGRTRVGF